VFKILDTGEEKFIVVNVRKNTDVAVEDSRENSLHKGGPWVGGARF